MSDQRLDGLWNFYQEQAAQARQHEDLRAAVTSALVGISGTMIALAGLGGLTPADIPTGIAVVAIGAIGVVLSLKHYERNRFHAKVMGATRSQIDAIAFSGVGEQSTKGIRGVAEKANRRDHPLLEPVRLHVLWALLPASVCVLGILVVVFAANAVGES